MNLVEAIARSVTLYAIVLESFTRIYILGKINQTSLYLV
jgi:hypothetical protein